MTDEGIKENERLNTIIAEQEETIDAQDDKINFYVAKMNEYILKNKELEKQLDCYKAFESHCEEIEEDAKAIAKENEKLKKEINVLLSCSNCSENKGGYICEKEYNDKCLAQKIEYIKELKEEIKLIESVSDANADENRELKAQIENYQLAENESKEIIAELKAQIEEMRKCLDKWYSQYSDNGYTEYFYKCLLEQTKNFLFTDVSTK